MPFDIKTLIYCNALLGIFMGVALLYYKTGQKTYPGFGFWMVASFVVAFGYASFLLRLIMPDWISILLANGGFALVGVLRLDGVTRFTSERKIKRIWYVTPLIVMAGCTYFYFVRDSLVLRNLILSTGISVVVTMTVLELFRNTTSSSRRIYLATIVLYGSYGFLVMLQALLSFINPFEKFFQAGIIHNFYFLAITVFEAGLGIVFLMMNNQRLELEWLESKGILQKMVTKLEDAMSEVKKLSGLLPICAKCKKIRDDKGYWNNLEEYIQTHSDVSFSHGICSECSDELYGKEDWYVEMKKEDEKKE